MEQEWDVTVEGEAVGVEGEGVHMTYLQCHQGFRGMGVRIFERPTSRLEQESVEGEAAAVEGKAVIVEREGVRRT